MNSRPFFAVSIVYEREESLDAFRYPLFFGRKEFRAKIAGAEKSRVHIMLVIGRRNVEAGNVSVRLQGKGNVGVKPKAEVIADILAAIKD